MGDRIAFILAMNFASGMYLGIALTTKDLRDLIASVILLVGAVVYTCYKIKPNKDKNVQGSDTTDAAQRTEP